MKIGRSTNGISGTTTVRGGAKASRPADKPGQQSLRTGDEVSLTAHVQQIRLLEDLASKAPVVNAGRVEELRQAIAEGRLKVDSEAIAGKLLAAVNELTQRGRHK